MTSSKLKLWEIKWLQISSVVVPIDANLQIAMPQVVVTRPKQDANSWVQALSDAGYQAIEFPLLELSEFLNAQTADEALIQIKRSHAVMFVSANAVRFLAQALQSRSEWVAHFKNGARAWCTGPGTAAALVQIGVPFEQIDQPALQAKQLDSEALWEVVSPQVTPDMNVLFVRGADESGAAAGRDWLAQKLEKSQVRVGTIAAYQRSAAQLTSFQKERDHQLIAEGAIWLFSSSAALQNLMAQCPEANWADAKATVTHPRMADLAQKKGWGFVSIAPPGIHSMLASIKSLT
jgi:uroporphyrinogen-III synthase